MKNQVRYDEKSYGKAKNNVLETVKRGVTVIGDEKIVKALKRNYPEMADCDADLAWIHLCACSENFAKPLPLKKVEKIIAEARRKEPIGDNTFSAECERKVEAYIDMCRAKAKRAKHVKIGVTIAVCLLLVCVAVGVYFGDRTGFFYGQQSLSFMANGQEYRQENALRYNDYVQLSIPMKKGYDATGIIDARTQTQLFDATGKSLSVVTSRNLSDYENCTLEATYEPHVYSAQVMSAKNVSLASVTYTVEDDPEEIFDEPQHLDGYVFDGWYTDAKFKKPFTGDFMDYADADQPLVLYPHYSLDGWTLTWQLNGGAFKSDVVDTYTILSDVRLPDGDTVVREGYILSGWSLDGKMIDYFTPTIMRDTVLSALWEPIYYRLTYELNGGSFDNAATTFTIEDEFLLESPIKPGYIFDGWYANKLLTKSVVAIEQGTVGDKTVYAKWTPIVYTIDYTLNGGENSPFNPTKYTADKNVMLQKPQRKGYKFNGWVSSNEKITELNAVENGSVELIALWDANEYTITVNPNNGSEVYKQTVRYDDYYSIAIPVRKGYTFTGFSMSGEPIDSVGQYSFTSDISVIATYKANQYTISYVSDATTVSLQRVTYDEPYSLYNPKTKLNHEFLGWFDKEVGGNRVSDGVYKTDGNIVLYAQWMKVLRLELESYTDYVVDNTIQKVYLIGNYNGHDNLMSDITVKVLYRDYDLTVCLDHVGFRAKRNCNAIDCDNSSYTLTIINTGISQIEGGKGDDGANGVSGSKMTADNRNGQNGKSGGTAINAGCVVFEATDNQSSLTLKGGDGGRGGNGGVDWDRSRPWLTYVPDGGNGGDSGSALNCVAYSINGTKVTFEKALPGSKGLAGSRGDWWCLACYGSCGKDGQQKQAIIYK